MRWIKKDKNKFLGLIAKAKEILKVPNSILNVKFIDQQKREGDFIINAEIEYDPVYEKGTIYFYSTCINKSQEDIKLIIFHEIAHVLTQRLRDLAIDRFSTEKEIDNEWETLTERIAKLVYEL